MAIPYFFSVGEVSNEIDGHALAVKLPYGGGHSAIQVSPNDATSTYEIVLEGGIVVDRQGVTDFSEIITVSGTGVKIVPFVPIPSAIYRVRFLSVDGDQSLICQILVG